MSVDIIKQKVVTYYSVVFDIKNILSKNRNMLIGIVKKVQDADGEEIYVTKAYVGENEVNLTDELEDKIYQAFTHTNYEYVSMSRRARMERRDLYKDTIYSDADDDELAERENNEIRKEHLKI